MIVRNVQTNDINTIVQLHKKNFDKTHFTSQFPNYLLRKYFRFLMNQSLFYVAEESEEIYGYLIGGNRSNLNLNRFIKDNVMSIIVVLSTHPGFLLEKINLIFGKAAKQDHSNIVTRLYLIAVDSKKRCTGVGSQLLLHFENELRKTGITQYGLSVRKGNIEADSFYRKKNYIRENENGYSIYYMKNI